ncbi:2-oxoglutarate dehydrogenase complex dihydrolipoyllysine-residue succinyltransferase [Ilyomonas limi]|uniref:Dihydrolipoyllysine-residue succinyltransferase component of 2-oxoglutarate dehydrogenase complex n=1 Tax=Ilyomonas limi TaxID=2575867 RepID=A0A4U3KT07_9BACT|nr:2-oxoglutarate dehydrogenase complex dihydrolipoyllysine-residue succinyltransferase [Ilyomonas limi]TKK65528.1 2-oxoglutarate dehydrogenase complex dihydrolipoyllysine-residue succinyltransferase [Ilyomonas limi]
MIDIKVPAVGESISEVTLLKWVKNDGDYVNRDEVIAELESEKATFEVNAEQAGVLKTAAKEGDTIAVGATIASIDDQAQSPQFAPEAPQQEAIAPEQTPFASAPQVAFAPDIAPAPAPPQPVAVGKGNITMKVPTVGESISEVTLLKWVKNDGDYVNRDEVIAELESEKATFELNAEEGGQLQTKAQEGDVLKIGDVIAVINTDVAPPTREAAKPSPVPPAQQQKTETITVQKPAEVKPSASSTAPVTSVSNDIKATPLASAILADKKVDPATIKPSGSNGKILKHDVLEALQNPGKKAFAGQELNTRNERREKMSNLRKTISRRLVESKNTTAMLTTFNEVDMTRIMDIRKQYKDKFKESHGVNLGFMSFFAKACAIALSEWPAVNAYIDNDTLIYHDYADISIAVSTPRGLTVPVIRNVESLSMADIEKKVIELAGKARDNKLTMEELQGGTFTITNGGVFGSLMSTPIINLPQSAILGMHKIQERPMAVNGQVVIRPMMYVALSYDHRIIDGRESVSFLVRLKELLENPELLLFGKDPVKTLLEL